MLNKSGIPKDLHKMVLENNAKETLITTEHIVYDENNEPQGSTYFDLINNESLGTRKLFSLAGPIIARMAMDYGELIDGLVSVAGSLSPDLEPKEWYRPYFKAVPWFFADMLVASNLEIMAHKAELTKMLPLWETIKTPTIVIQGTKDDLVHPNNAAFAKAKMINAMVRLEIVENVPLEIHSNCHNKKYLDTKKAKGGHEIMK